MSVQPGASSGQSSGSQGGSGNQGGGGAPGAGAPQRGGQTAAAGGGEAAGFDFRGELARTKAELTQGLSQQFGRELQSVKGGQSKSDAILAKIAKAFEAEGEGAAPDPAAQHQSRLAQLEAEMDSVVEAAYEADKRGQPIPLTAKANITALQTAIQMEKFQNQVMAELRKLQGGVQQANSPDMAVNRQAFSNMDGHVAGLLDQIYGMDERAMDTKRFQFQAVTSQMTKAVKEMQQSHPEQWDQIRRNPQLQQQMTQHFVKQMLPPKAVQMMEQEHLQNTELSTEDLWAAFRQTKTAYEKDPETGRKVREKIRQQILERSFGGQKAASGHRGR